MGDEAKSKITATMCRNCACEKSMHNVDGMCMKHIECEKYKPLGKHNADQIRPLYENMTRASKSRGGISVEGGYLMGDEALEWAAQKEMVRGIWQHLPVRQELSAVLKPAHFRNTALGWIAAILLRTADPATTGALEEEVRKLEPHMQAACLSLIPEVQAAETPAAGWTLTQGRRFAAHAEAVILAGQLAGLAKAGQYDRMRNRLDEVLRLASTVETEDDLVVKRMDQVAAQRTTWLWNGFLPFGRIVLLDGDPKLGKSTLLLDIAARYTTAQPMPFDEGPTAEPRDVIVLSAEDAAADTIRPRLEAAGADLSMVHVVTAVKDKDDERHFTIMEDQERLENLAQRVNAGFIIVDPLVAYLGGMDFHRDQDVRRVMRALNGIAERRNLCVCAIRHMNKSKSADLIYRGGGSIGVIGAARVGLLLGKHPTDWATTEDRVFAVAFSNLSKIPQGIRMTLKDDAATGTAKVVWGDRTNHTAEDLVK